MRVTTLESTALATVGYDKARELLQGRVHPREGRIGRSPAPDA